VEAARGTVSHEALDEEARRALEALGYVDADGGGIPE
jgi:hypothetical protein